MKKPVTTHSGKMKVIFALIIVLLLAATFLLNAVALVLSNRFPLSVDLTANAAYEIGDETKQVLSALSQDITIDVLATEEAFSGDSYLVQAKRILEHYPQYSDRVSLRYIDYAADPGSCRQPPRPHPVRGRCDRLRQRPGAAGVHELPVQLRLYGFRLPDD